MVARFAAFCAAYPRMPREADPDAVVWKKAMDPVINALPAIGARAFRKHRTVGHGAQKAISPTIVDDTCRTARHIGTSYGVNIERI